MFEVGNRVIATKSYGKVRIGDTGTYAHREEYEPIHGVVWDEPSPRKHDCQGHSKNKHGWYVPNGYISLFSPPDLGALPEVEFGSESLLFGL